MDPLPLTTRGREIVRRLLEGEPVGEFEVKRMWEEIAKAQDLARERAEVGDAE